LVNGLHRLHRKAGVSSYILFEAWSLAVLAVSLLAEEGTADYASGMITVETTDAAVRVTIPKDSVPPRQLNAFLDWLRLEEIVQRSRLTDDDANRIAADIKAEWWAANKKRFIPPDER
jgi:hypothetical protein